MTAGDVIILLINQSESIVVVIFYISAPGDADVVSATDLVEALQGDNARKSFARFNLALAQVSVVHPITPMPTEKPTGKDAKDTGLSTAKIVGISVAAVGAVILIILLVIFLMYTTVHII